MATTSAYLGSFLPGTGGGSLSGLRQVHEVPAMHWWLQGFRELTWFCACPSLSVLACFYSFPWAGALGSIPSGSNTTAPQSELPWLLMTPVACWISSHCREAIVRSRNELCYHRPLSSSLGQLARDRRHVGAGHRRLAPWVRSSVASLRLRPGTFLVPPAAGRSRPQPIRTTKECRKESGGGL